MTTVYAIAMIAVAAVCTFATRVAPFLLFNGSRRSSDPSALPCRLQSSRCWPCTA